MFKPQDMVNSIEKICLVCSTVSLLAIMFFTTFDVLARRIFDYSIPGLYELTSDYLMVALVFLSLSHVYVKGGHVRVTLFIGLIPKAIRPVLDKLLDLSALVMFVLIAILGWNNAVRAFEFNEVSNSLLAYPMAPAFLLVPIGVGMLAIRIIQSLFSSKSNNVDQETYTEDYIEEIRSASN